MNMLIDAVASVSGAGSTLVTALDAKKDKTENYRMMGSTNPAMKVLGQLIGLYAAYLSWVCSAAEPSMAKRILYAFIAWFFGLFYIIYFFAMKKGACSDGSKPELNPITHFRSGSASGSGAASSVSSEVPSAYLRF